MKLLNNKNNKNLIKNGQVQSSRKSRQAALKTANIKKTNDSKSWWNREKRNTEKERGEEGGR